MSDIDHHAEALSLLDIPGIFVRDDDTSPGGDRMIQEAQVHATLALVDAVNRFHDSYNYFEKMKEAER